MSKREFADRLFPAVAAVLEFQIWLEREDYGYLSHGVEAMPVGDAILEIARRAGVRGLTGSDSILMTLPMIQELIQLRCKRMPNAVAS